MDNSSNHAETARTTRRQFAKAVAIGAVAPLVSGEAAESQEARPDQPAEPNAATAAALTEIVRVRFRQHLSDEQVNHIKREILSRLRSAERLRRVKLQNSDEPDFIFGPELP